MAGFPVFFAGSVRSAGSNGTRRLAGKATRIFYNASRRNCPLLLRGAQRDRITITSRRD
jgi:hypothetical protein